MVKKRKISILICITFLILAAITFHSVLTKFELDYFFSDSGKATFKKSTIIKIVKCYKPGFAVGKYRQVTEYDNFKGYNLFYENGKLILKTSKFNRPMISNHGIIFNIKRDPSKDIYLLESYTKTGNKISSCSLGKVENILKFGTSNKMAYMHLYINNESLFYIYDSDCNVIMKKSIEFSYFYIHKNKYLVLLCRLRYEDNIYVKILDLNGRLLKVFNDSDQIEEFSNRFIIRHENILYILNDDLSTIKILPLNQKNQKFKEQLPYLRDYYNEHNTEVVILTRPNYHELKKNRETLEIFNQGKIYFQVDLKEPWYNIADYNKRNNKTTITLLKSCRDKNDSLLMDIVNIIPRRIFNCKLIIYKKCVIKIKDN